LTSIPAIGSAASDVEPSADLDATEERADGEPLVDLDAAEEPADDEPLVDLDATEEPAAVRPPRSSHPKKSVEVAWAAWQAAGTSSGSEFLQSVSSWTEGTAAQLLRRRWTPGFKPPTSTEVQERLRHNLGLAARGHQSTHMEALARARDSVIEELRRAQLPARTPASRPSAPTVRAVPLGGRTPPRRTQPESAARA